MNFNYERFLSRLKSRRYTLWKLIKSVTGKWILVVHIRKVDVVSCLKSLSHLLFVNLGAKFYCTINDILSSDGEFWVERELSPENERKFRQFIDILSLFATNYESLTEVYVGQLVALYYESLWHRALVVSRSEGPNITTQPSARVRLVDYGSSLYVNVAQLKWLPVQFYLFPFKVN
jgi:hypothetical protein